MSSRKAKPTGELERAIEPVSRVAVRRPSGVGEHAVAVEAALEIRIDGRPLAVTLRSPGHDVELALGFLLAEGVIERLADVNSWRLEKEGDGEVVDVQLRSAALDRWARRRVEREFRSTSACGACGKPSLEDLFIEPLRAGQTEDARQGSEGPLDLLNTDLAAWIERARDRQDVFQQTGGVHAAAAFDEGGECVALFEDVGRHNALDKLVGHSLRTRQGKALAMDGLIVLSTGRAGFEIVQKALRARAAGLFAIGATTSMAVALANEGGLPLVAFAGSSDPVSYPVESPDVADS